MLIVYLYVIMLLINDKELIKLETMKKMITITKDLNKRLKVYAALEEVSVQDLMIMILDKFLQERGY